MHSDRLGGPVWIFLEVVVVLAIGLAVFVVIDSVRRIRRCGPDERPWLLFYACLQGLYLLFVLVAQLSVMPRILGAVVAIATPLALIQSVAYLLRVVFPRRPDKTPPCELGEETLEPPAHEPDEAAY